MDTNKPEINFHLKRGDYYTPQEDPFQKKWSAESEAIADKES